MKYSSINRILFFTYVTSSTIHTGLAVPRPRPASKASVQQQRRTRDGSESSSSFGLLVDREGNLYSPRTSKTNAQEKETSVQNRALSLRGGEIYVDDEGNFYTPTPEEVPASKALREQTLPRKVPSSFTLRGGSHGNHILGGLSVDAEGNLFATQEKRSLSATPSKASSSALSLRGGSLCVDNEGNFYTPRHLDRVEEKHQQKLPSNRRIKTNGTDDVVLLTKNRLSKKISPSDNGSSRAKPRKSLTADDPMAFIGYNNALMET